jgi:hypothetical protein
LIINDLHQKTQKNRQQTGKTRNEQ